MVAIEGWSDSTYVRSDFLAVAIRVAAKSDEDRAEASNRWRFGGEAIAVAKSESEVTNNQTTNKPCASVSEHSGRSGIGSD